MTDCFSSARASRCFLVGTAASSTGINAGGAHLSVDNNVGFAIGGGVRMDMVCYGLDNHAKILVHTLHNGLLCHFLYHSQIPDAAHEGCVYRLSPDNYGLELLGA